MLGFMSMWLRECFESCGTSPTISRLEHFHTQTLHAAPQTTYEEFSYKEKKKWWRVGYMYLLYVTERADGIELK